LRGYRMSKKIMVTGGAGFIGSHLVDHLMDLGYHVVVIDNLSAGKLEFIKHWLEHEGFEFHKADLLDESISDLLKDVYAVFHFAANPEVRIGSQKPEAIWENNVLATYNLLEAMRKKEIKYIIFASSSTVYGEASKIPTPEDYAPLEPISVYGASKLACEAMISGYAHTFKIRALVLRYANIIGSRLRHGVIYDFIMKLKKNPNELEILGDGTQRKSYLHISDTVKATIHLFNYFEKENKLFDVYNVGNDDWVTVREIADIVSRAMNLKPKYRFTGGVEGGRGWIGDVKYMLLDISKLRKIGWEPELSSKEAVEKTAQELVSELLG